MPPYSHHSMIQCLRSSLSQDGGANLRRHFIVRIQTTLNQWMERSQLLPEILEIELRPFWWVAGKEQPSPCLQPPEAGGLLRRSQLRRWCCSICWLSTFHISQFCGNRISLEQHCNLPSLNLYQFALLMYSQTAFWSAQHQRCFERFLPAIEEMKKKAVWVEEDIAGNVSIVNADKPYLPVSADQKGHHSNERPGWYKYLL